MLSAAPPENSGLQPLFQIGRDCFHMNSGLQPLFHHTACSFFQPSNLRCKKYKVQSINMMMHQEALGHRIWK
ncbi:hypothetical protein Ccrd_014897 [Cynara cardunculus var. scolymus]|uniref:Uncharacterized protein n=1 Tax=Cynara cardunculus var. scolymus TaxID=59895 RepID=A0A103YCU4_CYNCS|nr:hypothetical protein Ccrd_014897 [Cynara cardunculus var. scolymus]